MVEPILPEQVIENRFELVEPVEHLGLGTCWKARDRRVRTRNKLVRLFAPLATGAAALPEGASRTLKALQSLRSPAVLEVIHHGVWSGRPFAVHEWFDGVSLDRALAELGPSGALPMEAARSVVDHVCGALEAALLLDASLTHGALSPRDVLVKNLASRPEVRVVGIGLAALEERRGSDPSRDDIRAVGAVLRALLASPEGGAWREGTPSGVVAWIDRCEGASGAAPVPTMKSLREGLRGAWSSEPMRAPAPTPARRVEAQMGVGAPAASNPAAAAVGIIVIPVTKATPMIAPPAAPFVPIAPEKVGTTPEHRGSTLVVTSLQSNEDDETDRTHRAQTLVARGRGPGALPTARDAPMERPEHTMLLSTLTSPEEGADELDDTRRAEPGALRTLLLRGTSEANAAKRAEQVASTLVLAAAPTPPLIAADDDETTRREAPSSSVRGAQAAQPLEPHDETVRVANFPHGMNPWQTGAIEPVVLPAALLRPPQNPSSNMPPTNDGKAVIAGARRRKHRVAVIVVGVAVLLAIGAMVLAR